MPKITIDNLAIEVPPGTKVIDAAEQLGIMIPRFCYLKALGTAGACRMCAVKFVEGPVRGINMSCMVDAKDGMVVSTTDEETVDFRRHVIEWLMMNHPHDCPVCDEGGHCLLQDETVSGGHGIRRFLGPKRTYQDQYLGPLVQHEMNRCIQCYRCSRFYQEYAGYFDLGVMGIATRTYFGRYEEGTLQSPFSGNLIDICPTGVYTDKPSRYRARRWDLERAPSICLHCALGCNIIGGARYREVLRLESRENPKVNAFICDRGRYGFAYTSQKERPRKPRADNRPVALGEAIRLAADRLTAISRQAGGGAVAVLGSARSSLETQALLGYLSHHKQWRPPHFFANASHEEITRTVVRRLDGRISAALPDLEQSDCLLAVGIDPLGEAPMLALAMRQAFRKGARIMVIDPRPVELPFSFEHIPIGVDELEIALALLTRGAAAKAGVSALTAEGKKYFHSLPHQSQLAAPLTGKLQDFAARLAASRRPAIICGGRIIPPGLPQLAADFAWLLRGAGRDVRLFCDLPGPNAFGAGLLSPAGHSITSTLKLLEEGEIKALVVVENDPLFHCPEPARLARALDRLELLVVIDYLPSVIADKAHIWLPSATVFEAGGSFVNQSGRLQYAAPVHGGGTPIHQVSHESHPPRSFREEPAGREFAAAYQILLELGKLIEIHPPDASPWSLLPEDFPISAALLQQPYPVADGFDLLPQTGSEPAMAQPPGPWPAVESGRQELRVVAVESLFGTEELSRFSEVLRRVADPPQVILHPEDGGKIGLAGPGRLRLHLAGQDLEFPVQLSENMTAGHLIVPRGHELFQAAGTEQLVVKLSDFAISNQ